MKDPRRAPRRKVKRFDPAYLVALYAIASAVTPQFTVLGIPKVRITDLMLPVILATYMGTLRRPGKKRERLPLMGIMTAIMVWDLLVLFVFGHVHSHRMGIFYLGKRFIYFLIFIMGVALIEDRAGFERALWGLIGAAPLLNASVLIASRRDLTEGQTRVSGIIHDQEASTALFLVLVLCLVLGMWPAARKQWQRVLLAISLTTSVLAILATGSKMGLILAVLVALPTTLRATRQSPGLVLIVGLVALLGVSYTPARVLHRFTRIKAETTNAYRGLTDENTHYGHGAGHDSIAARFMGAKYAFDTIRKSPLVGMGTAYEGLGVVDDFYITEWLYHGLIGVLLWLILLWQMVALLWRAQATAEDPIEQGAAYGAFIALLAYCVAGLAADSFYLIRPMEGLMLTIGVVVGRLRARNPDAIGRGPAPRRPRPRRGPPQPGSPPARRPGRRPPPQDLR